MPNATTGAGERRANCPNTHEPNSRGRIKKIGWRLMWASERNRDISSILKDEKLLNYAVRLTHLTALFP